MINNNPISYENQNKIQNYAYDTKKQIEENQENKKETARTAAVTVSSVKHKEDLINTYINSSNDNESQENVDLTGSNINYQDVNDKYNQYQNQKINLIQKSYEQIENKIKDNYSTIQSQGNFLDIKV